MNVMNILNSLSATWTTILAVPYKITPPIQPPPHPDEYFYMFIIILGAIAGIMDRIRYEQEHPNGW